MLWNTIQMIILDIIKSTWLGTQASWNLLRNLFRNSVEPDLALHQSLPEPSPDLLRNLLRNPVEPDLALHQSLPDFLRNLRNLLRNLVEPDTGAVLGLKTHH